jgi:3-deoxy-D-manno-octulosonic-acid transferase
MRLLLDLAYLAAAIVLSPWLLYRLASRDGRAAFARRLGFGLGAPVERSIWLHGSSVGEVTLLRPLIETLEREQPATPLVISAVTATGLATARKLYARHRVVPLPFDLSFTVRRALARFDPRLLIVVESELWPGLLSGARRHGAPVVVVNGKMSAKSHRWHARTGWLRRVLRELELVLVQTEEHAVRFRSLGVPSERVRVTGNMKYDLTPPGLADARDTLRAALGFTDNDLVVIGGSLHEQEDEALLDAFAAVRAAVPPSGLIVVPRYPADTPLVEQHARARGYDPVRKSAVQAGAALPPGTRGVLIVDTIGELGRLYDAADVAFVGGSLFYRGSNKGGHNLMEPAILGVPVLFGPYNFSFKETVEDLIAADAGRLVRDASALRDALVTLACDPAARRALGQRGAEVVRGKRGATERNYALIAQVLAVREPRLQAIAFDRKMPRPAGGARIEP